MTFKTTFDQFDMTFTTTGGEPPRGLRREFREEGQWTIDAPDFLPCGAANNGLDTPMVPRAGWEYIESFF